MRKAIVSLSAVALAVVGVALAQEKPAATTPAQPAPAATETASADPVIITAGSIAVHRSEFENAVKSLPPEYQSYALGPGKKQFADDFLRMKLLASEGMKAGLDKSPDVMKQLDLLKENLVAQEELKRLDSSTAVSDADLKKAYDENKKDYEQVKAKHILIAFKGSPAAQKGKKELTDAEAKARAEALRADIVAGKAKFEDVAKKDSDDVESGKNGGELGAFGHGQMVPEFEAAAFNAKVGEVTQPVKTQFGYHIIKVEERTTTPFDQVKATLEKNLKQQKLRETLDALKENAKPVYDQAYFATPKPAEAPKSAPAKPEANKQ
ncbi:MAG TPA: peptidylprolyl isomerase [Thermoanaerobaculia bacterium]|nr:peptidylprolyl isomerase [Thermoanaerobaculia bacterium]